MTNRDRVYAYIKTNGPCTINDVVNALTAELGVIAAPSPSAVDRIMKTGLKRGEVKAEWLPRGQSGMKRVWRIA